MKLSRAVPLLTLLTGCPVGPALAPDGGAPDAGPPAPPDSGPVTVPDAGPVTDAGPESLTAWVDPLIGTGEDAPDYNLNNAGAHLFPGAVRPFGMAQFSPDTTSGAGGYRYSHTSIHGFSLTHFSGRGISCYQELPLMPVLGVPKSSPGTHWGDYSSDFRHATETVKPGYYAVTLDAHDIDVALTSTRRAGHARITFPYASDAVVLLNAGGSANGNWGDTGITVTGPDTLEGTAVSGNCGGGFSYTLHYAVQFDRPFVQHGTWTGDALTEGSDHAKGGQSGAYVSFDATAVSTVQVKVGLSFVSAAKARENLTAEDPGWDFDAVAKDADAEWNEKLHRIEIAGGTDDQRRVFYTALYHAMIHPSTFSDVDGQYVGFDGAVHEGDGRMQFHNFPAWDNYRSQMRLLPLIAPEMADMAQSLVRDAQQDPGGGLPRWEHANANSGGMIGDSEDVVLAGAYAFGVRDFDAQAALHAMQRGAEDGATCTAHPTREGNDNYLSRGYLTTDDGDSASRTLEYASDDFAMSQLADALGDTAGATAARARSRNWLNLWDPNRGYIVPKHSNGNFITTFDPTRTTDYTEGSAGQYVWLVPFNYRGLFDQMGGDDAALARLDHHTTQLNAGPFTDLLFMGNEPELGTPWAYNWMGAPHRTQKVVRDVWLQLFGTAPGAYPGNDDGGALSSWLVFAALGLYPEIPGVGGFTLGSPLFPQATVHLANGHDWVIRAPNASATTPYVQSLRVNGARFDGTWLDWNAIANGATFDFALGSAPNLSFGHDPAHAPPSFE